MALSTQKQFFLLQYANGGGILPEANQAATKAKTFEECNDKRAWVASQDSQAQYLLDQVHRRDELDGGGDGQGAHAGRFNLDALKAMSKPELIKHIQDLYKSMARKNDEMLRLERLLEETIVKLSNIHNIVEENGQLRDLLRKSNDAVETLNREQALIQQNIRRRSQEGDFGQLRSDYEYHRAKGQLTQAEEIKYLKRQLNALENDANRVAVAEAAAQSCREELERLRQRDRVQPKVSSPESRVANNQVPGVFQEPPSSLCSACGIALGMRQDPCGPNAPCATSNVLAAAQQDARNVAAGQSNDVKDLQSRCNDLTMELRNVEAEYAELRRRNDRLESDLQRCLDGNAGGGGGAAAAGGGSPGGGGGGGGNLTKTPSQISRQVEQVLNERDRLRNQLDKMTSIEDKLLALKNRAEGCADLERERDELLAVCKQQRRDIAVLKGDLTESMEEMLRLERENGKMVSQSADGLKEQLRTASEAAVYIQAVETDLENTKTQLGAAEAAIAEYEKDIQENLATINALNADLAAKEERLRMLDELESEVNTLQAQLSAALALQKSQQNADLVAAVKLTLLYVQNKLTSRETMGNEDELERLKAELLNLRERSETEMLLDARAEIERLQALLNTSVTRDEQAIVDATQNILAIRHDVGELRKNMAQAGSDLRRVVVKTKQSVRDLQGRANKSDSIIAEQENTIQGLQQHAERASIRLANVEDDMSAQLHELMQDNANLREQIAILNAQMDELSALIADIERERSMNKGLQDELNELERVMRGMPQPLCGVGMEEVQHAGDALRTCTNQLEAECGKNQALEQQVAQLKAHVFMLKEKLRRFVSRSSELELADVTNRNLADRLAQLEAAGEAGTENVRVGNYNKSACPCGCLMVNESDELFNKQNTKQDENWRKYCEKILKCGIGALNLRELSELHQLVYLAGLRYTHEIRRRRAAYCGVRLKEKRNFYERKELEHQQKVHELQHQLNEIKGAMRQLRQEEAMRSKREHVLQNAYRAMNKSDEILHQRCRASGDASSADIGSGELCTCVCPISRRNRDSFKPCDCKPRRKRSRSVI